LLATPSPDPDGKVPAGKCGINVEHLRFSSYGFSPSQQSIVKEKK
jgi:hypothetical protein